MQPFTERVINIVKDIPEGYVMTYGQVAEVAGSKRGARQVVRILHTMSDKYKLPWHRVINAQGEIVMKNEEANFIQKHNLQQEGIDFDVHGRIDLKKYRFQPKINQ